MNEEMKFERRERREGHPKRYSPEMRNGSERRCNHRSREEWRAADTRFAISHAAVFEGRVLLGEGRLRRCGERAVLV